MAAGRDSLAVPELPAEIQVTASWHIRLAALVYGILILAYMVLVFSL